MSSICNVVTGWKDVKGYFPCPLDLFSFSKGTELYGISGRGDMLLQKILDIDGVPTAGVGSLQNEIEEAKK